MLPAAPPNPIHSSTMGGKLTREMSECFGFVPGVVLSGAALAFPCERRIVEKAATIASGISKHPTG